MTDREIIELYNQRDERAIKETQTAYGKYCEKIAYNILGVSCDNNPQQRNTALSP